MATVGFAMDFSFKFKTMSRAFCVDVVMYPCHSRSVLADVGNLRDGGKIAHLLWAFEEQ